MKVVRHAIILKFPIIYAMRYDPFFCGTGGLVYFGISQCGVVSRICRYSSWPADYSLSFFAHIRVYTYSTITFFSSVYHAFFRRFLHYYYSILLFLLFNATRTMRAVTRKCLLLELRSRCTLRMRTLLATHRWLTSRMLVEFPVGQFSNTRRVMGIRWTLHSSVDVF